MAEINLLDELEKWRNSPSFHLFMKPSLTMLVVGLRGAGKSSLINSLIGSEKCKVQAPNCPNDCTKQCEKVSHNIVGCQLKVWNIPGSAKGNESQWFAWLDKKIFTQYDIIIYTIDMDQFDENISHDLKVMRLLTEHQRDIWKNAVIVLTKANKYSASVQDSDKSIMAEVSKKVWDLLEKEVYIAKEVAHLVPVVPAGLFNESKLDVIPQGMSWINNVWLAILSGAKLASKPLARKIAFHNIFKCREKICGDEVVKLIRIHEVIYKNRALASAIYHNLERKEVVGLASSFLHLQEEILERVPVKSESFKASCCQSVEDNNLLTYWNHACRSINVLVVGSLGSGKTALINSLLYGKEIIPEGHGLDPGTTKVQKFTLQFKHIECHFWDTPGLDNLKDLQQIKDKFSQIDLILFCVSVADSNSTTEKNIKKLTDALGAAVWDNAVIVATSANTIETSEDTHQEEPMKPLKQFIKTVLHSVASDISECIKVLPAGYHSDVRIPCNPDSFWGIDLWMEAIAASQNKAKPALITFLNSHHILQKQWGMLYSTERRLFRSSPTEIVSYYKAKLIKVLHNILIEQKLIT